MDLAALPNHKAPSETLFFFVFNSIYDPPKKSLGLSKEEEKDKSNSIIQHTWRMRDLLLSKYDQAKPKMARRHN